MFEKKIKQIAIQAAVLLSFIMAGVGWGSGLSPGVCTTRAVLGAGAAYFLVRIAGQLVWRVLFSVLVEEQIKRYEDSSQGQS